ncbi:MAG TPA: hypothetical protein VNS34_13940 [Rhizobiaceae bacterium]|nr:hypothetical protein [Rhizobiaceae bacterium]
MKVFLCLAAAAATMSSAARAQSDHACRDFFATHPSLVATEQSVDIEPTVKNVYDLARVGVTSFVELKTPCRAPEDLPDRRLKRTSAPVPILAGRSAEYPWLIYVYSSRQANGWEGVSAALVGYDDEGKPQSGIVVSQLLGSEGMVSKISSIVNPLQIISCRQMIKLVHRRANGDILKLPVPSRGTQECRAQSL